MNRGAMNDTEALIGYLFRYLVGSAEAAGSPRIGQGGTCIRWW